MKKYWIHIGLHKTGTTFIQHYCYTNRNFLIDRGYLFPLTGLRFPNNPTNPDALSGHANLQPLLIGGKSEIAKRMAQDFDREVLESNVNNILISSEVFSAPKNRNRCAEGVKKVFCSKGEVRVIIYLRRQDHFIESMYKEILGWKGRRETRNFNDFFSQEGNDWLDFIEIIRVWVNAVGKDSVIVRSYDDAIAGPGILNDFFEILNIDLIKLPTPDNNRRANPSVPSEYINVLRAFNSFSEFTNYDKAQIIQILSRATKCTYEKNKTIIDEKCHQIIIKGFMSQNEQILKDYITGPTQKFTRPELEETRFFFTPDMEMSLTKDIIQRLICPEHIKHKFLKPGSNNLTTYGVVTTLKETPEQTREFIYYYLNMRVNHLVLFFDDSADPIANEFEQYDQVTCIKCTDEFWLKTIGRSPDNMAEKIRRNFETGSQILRDHGIKWIICVDADELLASKKESIQSELAALPSYVQIAQVRPLEAVQHRDMRDSQIFKALYFRQIPRPLKRWHRFLLKVFYWRTHEYLREGFMGHIEGKSFFRADAPIDVFSHHRPKSTTKELKSQVLKNVDLLHFDCMSFDGWRYKWWRRLFGSTRAVNISGKRELQQERIKEAFATQDDKQLRRIYTDFYWFSNIQLRVGKWCGLICCVKLPEHLFKSNN